MLRSDLTVVTNDVGNGGGVIRERLFLNQRGDRGADLDAQAQGYGRVDSACPIESPRTSKMTSPASKQSPPGHVK